MRSGIRGSVKFAVPIEIAVAPAKKNSSASVSGLDAALTDDRNLHRLRDLVDREHRDRADRRARRGRRETLPKRGRHASTSIAMPRTVLITASASAPAASAARATERDVGHVGRELDDERLVGGRARGAARLHAVRPASQPKVSPSLATFGHETLSSIAAISSRAARRSQTYA